MIGVLFWILVFPALGFILGVLLGKLLKFGKKQFAALGLLGGIAFTIWLLLNYR